MLFNSVEFVILLAITYSLYRVFPFRWQNLLLLVASYVFYGWWDVRFLFLVVLTTFINFYCGAMIDIGSLDKRNRQISSAAVVLSAFLFSTLNWDAIKLGSPLSVAVDWSRLISLSWSSKWVLVSSIVTIAFINWFYPKLKKLKPERRRKAFLWIGIVANLIFLAFFKYTNFFIDSLESAIQAVGVQANLLHLNVILPLGISFYTFKAISYVYDVYTGKLKACTNFTDFSLFLAYFPPMFSGPVDRAEKLLPQLSQPRQISLCETFDGLFLILFGLVKKVAIADGLAGSVDAIYGSTGVVSWLDIVMATVLYALQIYCDFCGYSDIARGVSKLFGIELILNFNLPYFSKGPSDFWRRWHISLSTWLRDYLYIPLGGNRKGNFRTYQNLMLTMVLGGLWHGAAWSFILWGFYQGFLLCLYRFVSRRVPQSLTTWLSRGVVGLIWGVAATILFFALTCYGWLLFRATSFEQILSFTQTLLTGFGNFSSVIPKPPLPALLGVPILIGYEVWEYASGNLNFRLRLLPPLRAAFYTALIVVLLMGQSNAPAQFIYSQF